MLGVEPWRAIESRWGPHAIDSMSLDSNVQRDNEGRPLRHFTPWPTPGSSGTNIFCQHLQPSENAYVFPPLALVGPVLRFLVPALHSFTMVLPDVFPR